MSLAHRLASLNGDNAVSKLFDDRQEYVAKYDEDYLIVGEELVDFFPDGKDIVFKTKKFGFSFKNGCRITGIGIVGSGKTVTNRAIMERAYLSKGFAVFGLDPKNEYNSSNLPAPKGQMMFYNKGERPRGVPVMSFKPIFFRTFDIKVPDNETNKPTGFSVNDLSFSDLNEIFKIDELPPLQQSFVQTLIFSMKKKLIKINTIEDLYAVVEKSDSLNSASKAGLKMKLNAFFSMDFFINPVENPVAWLNDNFIVMLNLERFDDVSKDGGAPHLAISIWHRKIMNSRKDDSLRLKKVLISLDEANRFIPANRNTAIKIDILESVELSRSYGVNYIFWYQTIGSVPPSILANSRYVLVPNNADYKTFEEAYKSTNIFKGHINNLRRHITFVQKRLKNFHRYAWLVLDRDFGSEHFVKFYTPMSKHDTKK